jgi:FkbM family methyltransferase
MRQTARPVDIPARFGDLSRRMPDIRGKSQLGWRLMRALQRRDRLRGEWLIALRDGTRYLLPRDTPMAWTLAFRGSYDDAIRDLLAQHIKPGTLVLDVGASLGLWTVDLGRRAQAQGARVWAFEPHPVNQRWLRRNIAMNGLGAAVEVHGVALGDRPGTASMKLGPGQVSGGNAAITGDGAGDGVAVPVVTLDSFAWPARVSAIKLDVEGYEVRVLRGAVDLIARDRPVILGEFNAIWLKLRGEDLSEFLCGLPDYRVFAVEQVRSRPWRSCDRTRVRPLVSGDTAENLLLIPSVRTSA